MNNKPKSILIVGGGTAGWLAANKFVHEWPECQITLVESETIGTIGVGEGSTPYLKQFFKEIGVAEQIWMPACTATYKLGIQFANWTSGAVKDQYFHPFFSVLDKPSAELFFYNCGLKRRGLEAPAHPDDYFVTPFMVQRQALPCDIKQKGIDIDYGYHFDATKLGIFLKDLAISKGVKHVIDDVNEVYTHADGDIASVGTQVNGNMTAELYVDCTGFHAKLIEKTLNESYISYANELFNDSAVALQIPHEPRKAYLPQTGSEALSNGWMWDIPLTARTGRGYVYSSKFIDSDAAEKELRERCNLLDSSISARHIKMRVGRLHHHLTKNCLAVGMSQGFIEPLEATALMLTQYTVSHFIQETNSNSLKYQSFNDEINRMFDGVRDYIVAHYKLNNRSDSEYWRANRNNANTPQVLKEILDAWKSGKDVEHVLTEHRSDLVYLRPSWYAILSGMNVFPSELQKSDRAASVEESRAYIHKVIDGMLVA